MIDNYLKKYLIERIKKYKVVTLLIIFTVCFFLFDLDGILDKTFTSISNLFSNVDGEIKQVTIKTNSYDEGVGGSVQITKSADWSSNDSVTLLYDVNTRIEESEKNKDVILVIDRTAGMTGSRFTKLIQDVEELIELLLLNEGNKVGIIIYNNSSEILIDFTNSKETLYKSLSTITPDQYYRSYYEPLLRVNEMLSDYQISSDRELVVLFIAGGAQNLDTPNEEGQYKILKEKYPNITIHGIVYQTHEALVNNLKNVSDNQIVSNDTKNHLLQLALNAEYYESFELIEYIDNDNFYVESLDDISVSIGNVSLSEEDNQQKIIWTVDSNDYRTGQDESMEINLKLNSNLIEKEGLYSLINSEIITYKLFNKELNSIKNTESPILKNGYNVVYDENLPKGCKTTIPDEIYYVNDSVDVSNKLLECEGWQFRGWEKIENVEYINDEIFIMPSNNLSLKAKWSKLQLNKSMTGTVFKSVDIIKKQVINFYEMYIHQEKFENVLFLNKSSVIPNYTGVDENNSISFSSRDDGIDNDINIANLNGNYTKGMILVLDFYSGHVSFGDNNFIHYEVLLSSRTSTADGITLWYHGYSDRLIFDPGGAKYRGYYNLQGAARYLFVYTYGGDYDGVIIINKTTNEIVDVIKQQAIPQNITSAFIANNYTISFGGESKKANDGLFYQAGPGLKFYSFYINDSGVTRKELNEILLEFNYDISKIDLSLIET